MEISIIESWIKNNQTQEIERIGQREPSLLHQISTLGVSLLRFALLEQQIEMAHCINKYIYQASIFDICAIGRFEDLAILLIRQPDIINLFDADGMTPLALACFYGHEEMIKWLLKKGADINLPTKDKDNNSPLHWAVGAQHLAICQTLLESNANVNSLQVNGISPLHLAAIQGNIDIIILLLEQGGDLRLKTKTGKTAANLASEQGYSDIANLLGEMNE